MNLRKVVLGTLLAAFLAASVYIQWEAHRRLPDVRLFDVDAPELGQPAPDFELSVLDGETVSLKEFRGRFVLLDFWATWCGPCRQSMPLLEHLQQEHPDDLVLLAVNLSEADDTVRDYLRSEGLSVTVLMDRDGSVGRAYGVSEIPTQVLIDPKGQTAYRQVGFTPMMIPALKQRIGEAD